jgi:hypothetical protein
MTQQYLRSERKLYLLDPIPTPTNGPKPSKSVSHHVLVVDRSGSMWGDINDLKATILQALAVDSAVNGDPLITLVTFSNMVRKVFSRVPLSRVLRLSSQEHRSIQAISAGGLTCMSKALFMGLEEVRDDETTGMTLFTDGYANHPSTYSEVQNIERFLGDAKQRQNLFLNTVGYRDWCDWTLMRRMANTLSGRSVRARSFRDVLSVLRDTQKLLAEGSSRGGALFESPGRKLLAIDRSAGNERVLLAQDKLQVPVVNDPAQLHVFSVTEIDDPNASVHRAARAVSQEQSWITAGLALGYLQSGDIRAAKSIIFKSGNKSVWADTKTAVTQTQLQAVSDQLHSWATQPEPSTRGFTWGRNTHPQHSMADFMLRINALPERSLGLDVERFMKNYKRRSVRRVPTAATTTRLRSRDGVYYIRGMSANKDEATLQLNTVTDAELLKDGDVVNMVEHVSLTQLKDYRSYTVMSSGEYTVESLPLRVYNQLGWAAIQEFVEAKYRSGGFVPGKLVRVNLKQFRLDGDAAPSASKLEQTVTDMLQAEAELRVLRAAQQPDAASPYSAGQVAALRAHDLTAKLYYSPKTGYSYDDREDAINKGEIDCYTRYKIAFGTADILSPKKYRSGNAAFQRFYRVAVDGNEVKKAKLADSLQNRTASITRKTIASANGPDAKMLSALRKLIGGGRMMPAQLATLLEQKEEEVNRLYADTLQPLVFEIGCTGLLPVQLEKDFERLTADDFAKATGAKLAKADQETIFFLNKSSGTVISVSPTDAWYSVS